jgi:hypothetical protein
MVGLIRSHDQSSKLGKAGLNDWYLSFGLAFLRKNVPEAKGLITRARHQRLPIGARR